MREGDVNTMKESAKPSYSVSARTGIERREREREKAQNRVDRVKSESSIC